MKDGYPIHVNLLLNSTEEAENITFVLFLCIYPGKMNVDVTISVNGMQKYIKEWVNLFSLRKKMLIMRFYMENNSKM